MGERGPEREPGTSDQHGEGETEKAAQEGGTWLRTQEALTKAGRGGSNGKFPQDTKEYLRK